jgi:hypothetical protein
MIISECIWGALLTALRSVRRRCARSLCTQDGTFIGLHAGCDVRGANVSHLALATVSGRPYMHVPQGKNSNNYGALHVKPQPASVQLESGHVVLADCSGALEALSPPLPALLEARQRDRDVLQALVNYQLSERTPADALALRSAAERAALDTGRLEWDGDTWLAGCATRRQCHPQVRPRLPPSCDERERRLPTLPAAGRALHVACATLAAARHTDMRVTSGGDSFRLAPSVGPYASGSAMPYLALAPQLM